MREPKWGLAKTAKLLIVVACLAVASALLGATIGRVRMRCHTRVANHRAAALGRKAPFSSSSSSSTPSLSPGGCVAGGQWKHQSKQQQHQQQPFSSSSQLHGPLTDAQAADVISRATQARGSTREGCPLLPPPGRAPGGAPTSNNDNNNSKGSTAPPYTRWLPVSSSSLRPHHHALTPQPDHQPCSNNNPDFCPSLYPATEESDRIAQLIYDHQNPRDCSQANFLVLTREWHSGLGSNIHVKAWMLLVAIMSDRILVDSPNIKWNMTNPTSCPQMDWTCYFAPVSKCALPQDYWDESQVPEFATEDLTNERTTTRSPRKYVRAIAHPQPLNGALVMGQGDAVRIKGFGGSSTFNDKPNSWWMTHATVYVIRPNQRTLDVACWYWSCMPIQFAPSSQQQPAASIYVRSGDKWKEANLRTAQEHFDALDAFVDANPTLRPLSVYFGTDDALVLSDVVRKYHGHKYNLTWIGYHRDVKGLSFEETMTRAYSAKAEWQVLVSLSDLYISSLADIFVGTLSSNWCRLTDELRKAHGKAGLPYLTPQGEPLVAGV